MSWIALKQLGILVCLLLTSYIIMDISAGANSARTVYITNVHAADGHALQVQTSPLASPLSSPLSMPQPMSAQDRSSSLPQLQLPIYSGKQADQSSTVLIGAVLMGLVVVGILSITRKE